VKKYTIKFLDTAYSGLADAISNISQVSHKAAVRFMDELDDQTGYLADMPKMYPMDEDHPPYRKIVLQDYLVFYTVNEEEQQVEIVHILPGRMNLTRFFN
jgi:plasmid stabilization system protein ParE